MPESHQAVPSNTTVGAAHDGVVVTAGSTSCGPSEASVSRRQARSPMPRTDAPCDTNAGTGSLPPGVTDLYERAAVVLGQDDVGICWPYGLEPPPLSLISLDPGAYERRAAHARVRQEVLVAWAERHGLRQSRADCCPLWLGRARSKRCALFAPDCRCTRYGVSHPDSGWLEHTVAWLRDDRPTVLTAAPCGIDERYRRRLAYWEQVDPRLRTATGTGWYGSGTTQIVLWRRDRIAHVEPARLQEEPDTAP
ncbi:hypothetical protein [Streptomyces melanogenes]|uniref:hypothetical protein n=1 Tax=Streptomyces melanogenes TaxID=67326 RepID=UPI001E327ECC|nr:hypothetical protein [Streptomyces melanogenes]